MLQGGEAFLLKDFVFLRFFFIFCFLSPPSWGPSPLSLPCGLSKSIDFSFRAFFFRFWSRFLFLLYVFFQFVLSMFFFFSCVSVCVAWREVCEMECVEWSVWWSVVWHEHGVCVWCLCVLESSTRPESSCEFEEQVLPPLFLSLLLHPPLPTHPHTRILMVCVWVWVWVWVWVCGRMGVWAHGCVCVCVFFCCEFDFFSF